MRNPLSVMWAAALLMAATRPIVAQDWSRALNADSALRVLQARAIEHNPSLGRRRAALRAAAERVRPAGALPDPMLSLGVMDLTLPRFRFGHSDFSELDAEVMQEFPWPGTLMARAASARAGQGIARAELGAHRREIVASVAETYFRLRYLATALALYSRQRNLLQVGVEVSTARYATGAVAQTDPLQAKVSRARLDAQQAAAEEDYAAGLASLRKLVGQAEDTVLIEPLDLERFRPDSLETIPAPDSLVALAVVDHPSLAAQRAALDQSAQAIRLARLASRPDFSLTLRYGYRGTVAGNALPDFFSAFVGLRIPLWAGRKQHRLADAARHDSAGVAESLREGELRLTQEVRELADRIAGSERRLVLLLEQVLPTSRAAVESARRSYQVGQVPFATVLTTQESLLSAELETAAVAAEHHSRLAMLRELTAKESEQ